MLKDTSQSAVKEAARNLGRRVHKQYSELTGSWEDAPVFTEKVETRGTRTTLEVKTLNNKYRWINLGTGPRDIVPRPENPTGMLVFTVPYAPATRPQSLQTRKSSRGEKVIVTPIVTGHKIEPRHFEIPIIKEQIPLVEKELRELIKESIKIGTETYGI